MQTDPSEIDPNTLYLDGVGGLSCNVFVNTGDYVQVLNSTKNPTRVLNFDLTNFEPGWDFTPTSMQDSDGFDVRSILDVTGVEVPRASIFGTSIGQIRMGNANNPAEPDLEFYTDSVKVTRLSDNYWDVWAKPEHARAVRLKQVKGNPAVANYYDLPFRFRIRKCEAASCP